MKSKDKIKPGSVFESFGKTVPKENKVFIAHSLDLVEEVNMVLESQNKKPVDLAKSLGKSESEISKWMSGFHNLTLKTISKIEVQLDKKIITTPSKANLIHLEELKKLEVKLKSLQEKIKSIKKEKEQLESQLVIKILENKTQECTSSISNTSQLPGEFNNYYIH